MARENSSRVVCLLAALVIVKGWRFPCSGNYFCRDGYGGAYTPGGYFGRPFHPGFRPFGIGPLAPFALGLRGIVQSSCLDTQGNPVGFGQVYFDGMIWRTCQRQFMRTKLQFMEDKWKTLFKVFDLDHDQLITTKDFKILKGNFINVYNTFGSIDGDIVAKQIDKFLHCSVYDALHSTKGLSETQFVALYRQAFLKDKAAAAQRMRTCNSYLLSVIDRNKDGFLSFSELYEDFKAWNQGNKKLVQAMFQLMGPNKDNLVPVKNFDNFYTEFPFGKNRQLFAKIKKIYAAAGFPM